jgi:hypothetical protein
MSRELAVVRRSVVRGSPYGDIEWTESTSRCLGLHSTLRPRGKPRKESWTMKRVLPPFLLDHEKSPDPNGTVVRK